ncbi:beta-3-galactosyltransferase-like, partial [Silurus asotus]
RRKSWKLNVAALITMTSLFVFMFLQFNNQNNKSQNKLSRTKSNSEPRASPDVLPSSFYKCETNLSASNISDFSTFPKRTQDFLFYRHCRHFPMLLNVPGKCGGPENSADVFLLLVIKSSPPNYERREVLRKTWASERLENDVWIRTVFLSGTTGQSFEKERLNKLLAMENREHQDIIQWDFEDSFYNLTLKQVLFLEWMEKFCPDVHFLLNGDDDIFANTGNMVQYLKGLDDNDGSKHLFTGAVNLFMPPVREPGSKYFVPVQMYALDSYPPYCGGGGFLLSHFTARIIYNMSHSISLIPIDDAYLGMCLEKAGLKPVFHIGVKTFGLYLPSDKLDLYDPCYYREVLLVHRFLPHQIFIMWHEIHREDLVCGRKGFS